MGQEKKTLSGFSSKATVNHAGLIYHSEVVQGAPPYLRSKALKVVSYKVCKVLSTRAGFVIVNQPVGNMLMR